MGRGRVQDNELNRDSQDRVLFLFEFASPFIFSNMILFELHPMSFELRVLSFFGHGGSYLLTGGGWRSTGSSEATTTISVKRSKIKGGSKIMYTVVALLF